MILNGLKPEDVSYVESKHLLRILGEVNDIEVIRLTPTSTRRWVPAKMFDQDRFVHVAFHIDANRINARGTLANMTQLEVWHEAGVILMQMSNVAQQEARAGRDLRRPRKAISYIFTLTQSYTAGEQAELRAIERLLFPEGATSQSERNDAEILFNAKKYTAILVTDDGDSKRQPGGMLGNRDALAQLGISVMTDAEAVAYTKQKIAERDQRLRWRAERDGAVLPPWVGRD